ncbi:hypothetical protein, partial [Yinghuangia sp. YIM S10712]|uniref:hypothetical protein n=1 Tax=Yinghuangia sp. YIM S10712 TaxID=3436930 RepID=UPI003F5355E8
MVRPQIPSQSPRRRDASSLPRYSPCPPAEKREPNVSVKVFERILQLFEAEGINTIFGIPD